VSTYSFAVVAMNTNGFAGALKLHNFSSMIRAYRPHAFIVNETKSDQPAGHRASTPGYTSYKSPGPKAGRGTRWRMGGYPWSQKRRSSTA
jgi:hypothetical protein